MNTDDYPRCTLGEDGFHQTMDRHCPGFPRELLSALIRLGYNGLIPSYRCHTFQAYGLNVCEVRVEIPIDPAVPWRGAVIGNEVDDTVKKLVHVDLTSLCERSLAITADTPLALFLIHNQVEPEWKQCRKAVSDSTSPQFNFQCSHLAKYMRYLFNL
jgi:hypothetical protein